MGDCDMTSILNGTLSAVEADIAAIDQLAAIWWQEKGYRVVEDSGKSALISKINGIDAPDLPLTTTWAKPVLAPDGTWYATSPSVNPQWVDWKERLVEIGYTLQTQEIEMPEMWKL